jgi:hypothetical protein
MAKPAVLAIGLDPVHADLSTMPGLTVDLVRQYVEAQIERLKAQGYDVVSCLVDTGETAPAAVEAALRARRFDCVLIGAGLRQPPALLPLFEQVINLAHRLAPDAHIAFNSHPGDSPDAVGRWTAPQPD